jgi:pimeloyl-ACP methyl ester carboxylesterase
MDVLVSDIIALADHYGLEKFHLAGHDFGSIVSWSLAESHPERLERMVIFNAPHPAVMSRFQEESKEQRKKSWYAYFFQLPWLPEMVTQAGNWRMLAGSLQGSFSEDEIDEYRRAWSQPGANTATINWYRALFRQNERDRPDSLPDRCSDPGGVGEGGPTHHVAERRTICYHDHIWPSGVYRQRHPLGAARCAGKNWGTTCRLFCQI